MQGGDWKQVGEIQFWGGPKGTSGWHFAVSGRWGGISPTPWRSLNMANGVGDQRERVEKNRRLFLRAAGFHRTLPIMVTQVHGHEIVEVKDEGAGVAHRSADALITNCSHLPIAVQVADCTPIFLYDPVGPALAAIHAGWRGTSQKIVEMAIGRLQARYQSEPSNLKAVIGPHIGACCYEVDEPVQRVFAEADLLFALEPSKNKEARWQLDLGAANEHILLARGVQPENVTNANLCTSCDARFFSHRRDGFPTGRMLAVAELTGGGSS